MDANHNHHLEGLGDDFLEHILANPTTYVSGNETGGRGGGDGSTVVELGSNSMAHQLGTGSGHVNGYLGMGIDMPLGLNLEHGGFFRPAAIDGLGHSDDPMPSSSTAQFNEKDVVNLPSLYPPYAQPQAVQHSASSRPQHPQAGVSSLNPPAVRPRVRARRGQATDPHSIAERLRRERITDRVKALQELVPSVNKTDRATMVDEIVDYVKFLRLQVKVLSMSRLGGTGPIGQLVSDVPLSLVEGRSSEYAWDIWSADGTEHQVAELMEKDVGEALQFLQSKALCIMPISLASSIFQSTNSSVSLETESNAPS